MRPFNLVFWAILCVLSGVVLLIRQFTPFNFSPFKIIVGLFVLLLGISLLINPMPFTSHININRGAGDTIFGQSNTNVSSSGEQNCIFGQSTVNLTDAQAGSVIKINCVFGQTDVILPTNIPVHLKANAAFGEARAPEMGSVNFGDRTYNYGGEGEGITVEVNVVFGQIVVRR
jgi:hypothetical protein